jgi:hypothetical protein
MTGSDGTFEFPDLLPVDYTVEEVNPPGYPDDASPNFIKVTPNAWVCFEKLHHDLGKLFVTRLAWDDLERSRDPKILEKSTFTVTKRFFGYRTEDKCTWERDSQKNTCMWSTPTEYIFWTCRQSRE